MTSPDSPPLQHLPGLSLEVSARFDFADADVTFQSSDSILFRVHRKNLEVCTEGFPPSGFAVTEGEIIALSETSVTLELLFQFIYPQRHPGLDATPFDVLEPLAEAAEKYQVFPAMNICHIRLRDMVHEHPVEVAIYAAKHDYPFLISEVAPMMISIPPIDVIQILPQSLVLPWTRYIQEWVRVHQNVALKLFSGQTPQYLYNQPISHAGGMPQSRQYPRAGSNYSKRCCWSSCVTIVLQHLGAGIHTLRSLDQVFHMGINQEDVENCCDWELLEWRRKIEEAIAQIPKFSAFL
ncbi:hypothetical protein C8F04DRAFT_1052819 [Mycena alexandri]|uniref:BTB domain-containing protein n=1 Tax=Mycena alexandri TaxID=1745969 RepID=A0AAD6WLD5_9AGAR|nr:hypothetical protein C8F04DRAFT_1052819 [Mycena alexandri]